MNKTVNINLAGTFFHIDEDAFTKLSNYLDAIRRSLRGTEGSEEIMQDIESRIAELFSEKIKSHNQVIGMVQLDEVIAVMGQPEDYEVDEEIFEESSSSENYTQSEPRTSHKQLFRDIDNKYVGGVSSGLGHYIGLDAIWIRLLWVLLVVAGLGSPILIYILLWILVPPAITTSQKLKMTGKPVNISNIERKFREGFDNVAEKVKNVDYDKYGNKIKTGASGFFDSLGEVIITLFRIFAKVIGVIIIIISMSTLIGLIIGMLTFGSIDFWGGYYLGDYALLTTTAPIWVWSILILLAAGIPFFALFVLGLKLLVSNLRPMNTTVKIFLTVLWALSIIGLSIVGIRQATETSHSGSIIKEHPLQIHRGDTLHITMKAGEHFGYDFNRSSDPKIKYGQDNEPLIYLRDLRINILSTNDSLGKIGIEKKAEGNNHLNAKNRAEAIDYNFSLNNHILYLDSFFTTDTENKYRDQKVNITLHIPEGTLITADENVQSFFNLNTNYSDLKSSPQHLYQIQKNRIECLDCEERQIIEATKDSLIPQEIDSLTPQKSEDWEQEVESNFRNI